MRLNVRLLLAGSIVSVCGGGAFALPQEGDDYVDQCTLQQVTLNYYQGTAYCTASVNGNNYPLSAYVPKTTESSVILKGGNGSSCRAQVPFFASETGVKNACTKVPAQPFFRPTAIGYGCVSQQQTGEVIVPTYTGFTYQLQRSIGGGPFQDVASGQYSIPGSRITVWYRMQTSERAAPNKTGSWAYLGPITADCQGKMDD